MHLHRKIHKVLPFLISICIILAAGILVHVVTTDNESSLSAITTAETKTSSAEMAGIETMPASTTVLADQNPTSTLPSSSIKAVPPPAQPKPAAAIQPPPAPPIPQPQIQTSTPTQDNSLPPERNIDAQSFVGILCFFNSTITNPINGATVEGYQWEQRGSGIIIDPRGYILTNRHVISMPQDQQIINVNGANISVTVDYKRDHCEVGQVPKGSILPTKADIASLNPYIRIPVLGYTASVLYTASPNQMSDTEYYEDDFAVMIIDGVSKEGPTFGVSSLPSSFPYAILLGSRAYLKAGDEILTYGFPGDIADAAQGAFATMDMQGSYGTVSRVEFGDTYFADTPLRIYTKLEISHGRSGSPLLWRGYVIGLTTWYFGDNRTDSGSVASDAIIKSLKALGYNSPSS